MVDLQRTDNGSAEQPRNPREREWERENPQYDWEGGLHVNWGGLLVCHSFLICFVLYNLIHTRNLRLTSDTHAQLISNLVSISTWQNFHGFIKPSQPTDPYHSQPQNFTRAGIFEIKKTQPVKSWISQKKMTENSFIARLQGEGRSSG